ncbi:hypothetical protein QUC32_12880 [Novosphingobium resinovorum]|uniref:hypothetical protein n=1 Tax=Novosphingobium TaxID=165696 RepID=UPI001B3C6994|nr:MULTISPECIES: hypothetical protein [Novosphingobium]MBF7010570.1 hypothetical protein [Novosphingobium sp. HR1a]WJM28569.1 hypothetical protein QUC32_12880 [Novosphingobium resinovorum]
MTIVVYGPPACGKTRNMDRLARLFGIDTIIDDWSPRRHALTPGAIHLTQEHPGDVPAACFAFSDLALPSSGSPSAKRVSPMVRNR